MLTCFAEKNPLPPIPSPPFSSTFQGYCASKISSHHAIMDFQAKNKPSFDVTTIHPSFVIGRSELITDPALITNPVVLSTSIRRCNATRAGPGSEDPRWSEVLC
jgi:hypothetical protein